MLTIDFESLMIGIGLGLFAVVCVRIIDYIFAKLKEKNNAA
jgi:hypothetical protein